MDLARRAAEVRPAHWPTRASTSVSESELHIYPEAGHHQLLAWVDEVAVRQHHQWVGWVCHPQEALEGECRTGRGHHLLVPRAITGGLLRIDSGRCGRYQARRPNRKSSTRTPAARHHHRCPAARAFLTLTLTAVIPVPILPILRRRRRRKRMIIPNIRNHVTALEQAWHLHDTPIEPPH